MIKTYDIIHRTGTVSKLTQVYPGCTEGNTAGLAASFETLDEAVKWFNDARTSVSRTTDGYLVDEYYLEINAFESEDALGDNAASETYVVAYTPITFEVYDADGVIYQTQDAFDALYIFERLAAERPEDMIVIRIDKMDVASPRDLNICEKLTDQIKRYQISYNSFGVCGLHHLEAEYHKFEGHSDVVTLNPYNTLTEACRALLELSTEIKYRGYSNQHHDYRFDVTEYWIDELVYDSQEDLDDDCTNDISGIACTDLQYTIEHKFDTVLTTGSYRKMYECYDELCEALDEENNYCGDLPKVYLNGLNVTHRFN